jgi:catechol 2,3-dioxygenase-like lactoylglutathione lyase family enzyme
MQPPEKIGNVIVAVPDLDAACAFYGDTMGLKQKFRDGDRFAAYDGGGVTLALVSGEEDVTGGVTAPSFKVADVAGAVADLEAGGATVVVGPAEGPHEIRAVVRDPAGNPLVLYGPKG